MFSSIYMKGLRKVNKIEITKSLGELIRLQIATQYNVSIDTVELRPPLESYRFNDPNLIGSVEFVRISMEFGPFQKYRLPLGAVDHFRGMHSPDLDYIPDKTLLESVKHYIAEPSEINFGSLIVTEHLSSEYMADKNNPERVFFATDTQIEHKFVCRRYTLTEEFIDAVILGRRI